MKPNLAEAEELLGRTLKGRDEWGQAALDLQAMGARSAIISLGREGAVAAFSGRLLYAGAVPVPAATSTGAIRASANPLFTPRTTSSSDSSPCWRPLGVTSARRSVKPARC